MSKREHLVAILLAANISFPIFTSCVDDSYDLNKDIDMTVNVGGNITIPGSDTEEIKLSQIMDLEDNTIIQTNEYGDYELRKSETNSDTKATIDPVTLDPTPTSPTLETLDFDAFHVIENEIEALVNDITLDFTFKNDGVTQELVELHSADVSCQSTLKLSFKEQSSGAEYLTLRRGFTIEFIMEGQNPNNPDNIKFELGEENLFTINKKKDFSIDEKKQTIIFNNDCKIMAGEELHIPINITRIHNFPEEPKQGLIKPGVFRLKAKAVGNGKAAIKQQSKNVSLVLQIDADFNSIHIKSAVGVADPDIDIEDETIEITGIPDFLADENTVLGLKNPIFTLEINNPTPFDINVNADIIREKDNEIDGEPLEIGRGLTDIDEQNNRIVFYGNKSSTYYLSRYALPEYEKPESNQYNRALGDGLYELIKTIPDQISLTSITAKALQNPVTFYLGDEEVDYTVTTSYSIMAPLQFGQDVHIEYNDTMADWSEDLEDLVVKKAIVTMDATNGIPLDFAMSAKAIDKDGKECKNIKVSIEEGKIAAGCKISHGPNTIDDAKQSHIKLVLECISDDMSELDGLAIKFVAENKENKYPDAILNENMTLRLSNIRFAIANGVTIDLN